MGLLSKKKVSIQFWDFGMKEQDDDENNKYISEALENGLNEMRKNDIYLWIFEGDLCPTPPQLISHKHTLNIPNPNSMS